MLAAQSHVLDDVLNEKNVDVSQFGVKSCERGELTLTMGRPGCLFTFLCQTPTSKQNPSALWSNELWTTLESNGTESGWSPALRVTTDFKAP